MKEKKTNSKKLLIIVSVFFLILIVVGFKIGVPFINQQRVDRLVQKGGYPEAKGKTPTFMTDIETSDSTTHVISYLSPSILPGEAFNTKAASEIIGYVEKVARDENTFTFKPRLSKDVEVNVKMVPRWKKHVEHYVYFISGEEQIPQIISNNKASYKLLSDEIQDKKTFFWTQSLENGSISFIRYAEPKTWQYGFPTENNKGISVIQQLNTGFNIEIWKRAAIARPEPEDLQFENHEETVFDSNESLWNTFGQLMTASQENIPVIMLERRYNGRILSHSTDRAYYPFDEKAQSIFKGAPKDPVIK